MSHCNSKYLGRSYNVFVLNCNTRADDTVDGVPEVVCSGGSLPKRVRTNNMLDQKRLSSFLPKPNEQTYHCFFSRWARPPRHLTKKLSIGIPSVSLVSRSLQYFRFSKISSSSILSSSWIFPVSCFVFSRLLCLALSSAFTFISPPGAFDCPPLLITTHLILYLIWFCISDGDPNQSCGCHSGRHIFALSASHFWTPHWSSPYILLDKYFNSTTTLFWSAGLEFVSHIGCKIYFYVYALTGY